MERDRSAAMPRSRAARGGAGGIRTLNPEASIPPPPPGGALRRRASRSGDVTDAPLRAGGRGAAQRRVVPRPGMAQLGAIAALVLSFLAAAFLSAIHKIEEGHIGVYYR